MHVPRRLLLYIFDVYSTGFLLRSTSVRFHYDEVRALRAVGADTLTEGIYEMAEEGGWIKVEWFGFFRPQKIN